MTRCSKVLRVLALIVGAFCLLKDVHAQEEGKLNGFEYQINNLAQTDWALSTSGTPNPNNIGRLSSAGNTWNLMAYRLESRINRLSWTKPVRRVMPRSSCALTALLRLG